MKLYLLSQDVNIDYDTYDAAVVAANNEAEARQTKVGSCEGESWDSWVKPELVKAEYIGEAKEGTTAGLILSSFNAG